MMIWYQNKPSCAENVSYNMKTQMFLMFTNKAQCWMEFHHEATVLHFLEVFFYENQFWNNTWKKKKLNPEIKVYGIKEMNSICCQLLYLCHEQQHRRIWILPRGKFKSSITQANNAPPTRGKFVLFLSLRSSIWPTKSILIPWCSGLFPVA